MEYIPSPSTLQTGHKLFPWPRRGNQELKYTEGLLNFLERGVSESLCLNRNGKAEPGDQKINPSKKYFGQCFHVYGDLSNMRASSLNY